MGGVRGGAGRGGAGLGGGAVWWGKRSDFARQMKLGESNSPVPDADFEWVGFLEGAGTEAVDLPLSESRYSLHLRVRHYSPGLEQELWVCR